MHITQEILSSITIFNKYAKYNRDKERRETWDEICDRYEEMMIKKYPTLEAEIEDKMEFIREKKVLMSMRAAQFSGPAITKNNSRVYNCAFLPIDDYRAFSEIMFLLLGGTGVGYSVQFSHIERLPEISIPTKKQKFLIGDSIEGWADAVRALMASYFGKRSTLPVFDFSDIRPKGARLVTAGGKAPGPEPLKRCLFEVQTILERKATGSKLSSLEVHDIVCHIADAVLAGGIRRAALIALFSADDDDINTEILC
jgi:ribonucleoside-triphosphate reductase